VWFLAAGASVGLAAATKYGGAVALVMPIVAAAGSGGTFANRARLAAVAMGVAVATFLLAAPYTVLDLPGFLNGFAGMAISYRPRTFYSGATIYLHDLAQEAGWPTFVALSAGLIWTTVRAIRTRQLVQWSLLLLFPLLYFHMIATKHLIFARYMLPILPFACLIAAVPVADFVVWLSRLERPLALRIATVGATLVLVMGHMASVGTRWSRSYGRITTQDVAYAQIRQFIPSHSLVAVEHSVLRLPDTAYREVAVRSLTERSLEEYVSSGVTFFVASSDAFGPVFAKPEEHPATYAAYRRLLESADECLPTVTRTGKVRGPDIRICRLRAP